MIVDVNNLNLSALRCYAFYNASAIAIAEQYGIDCKSEYYEEQLQKALAYLFLAEYCAENLTTSTFCSIQEFIDDALHSGLYQLKEEENCISSGDYYTPSSCTLSITDNATSCTDNLSINILL